MPYLAFELDVPDEKRAEYEEFLRLNSLGVEKCAEFLLRALQLMVPSGNHHRHSVIFTLGRHVAEEIDAVSILLGRGCVEPCKPHLRSAFEAELGIRYILQTDSERRAVAYHVKEARDRLAANEKMDARTSKGQRIREDIKNDPVGAGVLANLPAFDFDEENARLNSMLSRDPFDTVNAEWERRGNNAKWHSLFGGPWSIRDLAYAVERGFWYEFLYSDWSGRVHAGQVLRNVGKSSEDPSRNAIRPIRHPEGIGTVYNVGGLGLAVSVGTIISDTYLSQIGKDDLRRFYLEEIKPINEKVQNVKVTADWC